MLQLDRPFIAGGAKRGLGRSMLGALLHYPLRGAVRWKSIVGTNVMSRRMPSNLSSQDVKGGALLVVGEDLGQGASVIGGSGGCDGDDDGP